MDAKSVTTSLSEDINHIIIIYISYYYYNNPTHLIIPQNKKFIKKIAGKLSSQSEVSICGKIVETQSPHSSLTTLTTKKLEMAATRVIASAGNAVSGGFLCRGQFRAAPLSLNLTFRNGRLLTQKRRLFTCNAIQNPQLQIKEEGQPESFDYRVFFLDNSGKKVCQTRI